MKGCGMESRDLQMNAWTWRVYGTVKARRGMADDRYAVLYRLKCHDITGRLTMQTCLGSPEDPII